MKIICIGNYPPRQCGIATFTENLLNSVLLAAKQQGRKIEIGVAAMTDRQTVYRYPDIVVRSIPDQSVDAYRETADFINNSGADICLVQHEFGIFGGESGLLLLTMLKNINIPIVTTLHTVLENPSFHQLEIMKRIGRWSNAIVVMGRLAKGFLTSIYEIAEEKVFYIPHGVPDFGLLDRATMVRPAIWENKRVLLTFGLLGRSKGIETVIKAMPRIIAQHPNVIYVVLGKTHPNVVRHAGEEYREYLQDLAVRLGVEKYVFFVNEYVSEEALMNYLAQSEIYITPYLNRAQITSGTLSYAVSGGSAVISTPYWHAEELLAEGRGCLFDFGNHRQLAEVANRLLNDADELNAIRKNAYEFGLTLSWPKMGGKYLDLFDKIKVETLHIPVQPKTAVGNIPAFEIGHVEQLTDDTGIIQHARGCIPFYKTGYCIDDNARALLMAVKASRYYGDNRMKPFITKYLAFIIYMMNPDGTVINFLDYHGHKFDEGDTDDTFGRTIWSLAYLMRYAPCDSIKNITREMFSNSVNNLSKLHHLRGFANAIFGLYHYIRVYPDQDYYIKLMIDLADKLCESFQKHETGNWQWFEPMLTYDNGMLPAALYKAYVITENPLYLEIADKTSAFLERKCFVRGHLTIVGNKRWLRNGDEGFGFGQQPVDAFAMIMMYKSKNSAHGNENCRERIIQCFEWFLGENDLNLPLYDFDTHGCNDGLEEFCVNRNQGAESLLGYLMAWLWTDMYRIKQ